MAHRQVMEARLAGALALPVFCFSDNRRRLLVADHNAYHIGELVLLRRVVSAWAEK